MIRRHNQRGAALVEFSVVAPVFFGILGLAMYFAHIYEVRSDLQRAAERTAIFGAAQCDIRGAYPAGSACKTGAAHPSDDDMRAYLSNQFGQKATFGAPGGGGCTHTGAPVMCVTYSPNPPAGPVPNHRMRVHAFYTYDTPFAPFLKLLGLHDNLVQMEARGEATVE
jgi:hypothetical protein